MAKRDILTASLAIAGTMFVWFPIVAPVFFSLLLFDRAHMFSIDYLMPAELFPAVLGGGLALTWAAIRARSRRKIIGWSFGIAVGMLLGGQLLAKLTGLASGGAEPSGWQWALVVGSLAVYCPSVVAMGVGGVLLLRDLFKQLTMPAQGR